MLHPSTKKLIDRLAEMTELGKLDWTEGDNGDLVYSTEGYSVCLPDGAREVVIQSIDGKELERAAADALAGTMTEAGTPYTQVVAEMGAEAGRLARGTETAISSLLAGMEEPEVAEASDAPEAVDDSPEDPGDESAALASEGIVSHAAKLEAEAAPESADEPVTEITAAPSADDSEEVVDAQADFADADPVDEPETVEETSDDDPTVITVATDAPVETTETTSEEVDTESDVTEAVARLADEVNNRDNDTAPEPEAVNESTETASDEAAPSALGMAAATAVGVVATAAGLDQEEPTEPTPDTETEAASSEPDAPEMAPTPIEASTSKYVPFGLEEAEDTTEPIAAASPEATPEAEMVSTTDVEEVAPLAAVAPEPVSEPAPALVSETEEVVAVEPAEETAAPAEPAMSEPEVSEAIAESVAETSVSDPDPQVSADPEIAPTPPIEPEAEPQIAAETPVPAPAPETPTRVEPTEVEPAAGDLAETEKEPVVAAASEPQTYSLSGIGAGFGLGALAAKTEASGIPGPSAAPTSDPEKIVIDATEDVLPELEGNLNVEQMEAAVSEINFGAKQNGDASEDGTSEDDSEGDILKPRTRFNPWD